MLTGKLSSHIAPSVNDMKLEQEHVDIKIQHNNWASENRK